MEKFPERYITMPPMEAKKAATLASISISTAVVHTFDITSYLVELKNYGSYPIYLKYLTATDTNAVTATNRDIVIGAGETSFRYIRKSDHTGFSILSVGTASSMFITEY